MSRENNFGKAKKATGRRALSEARQYSQLHYGDETLREASVLDVIFAMNSFTTESVTENVDLIREGFNLESTEINQDIDRLNDSLSGDFGADCDTSVDYSLTLPSAMGALSLSANPVPSERMELCCVCNVKRPVSSLIQTNTAGRRGPLESNGQTMCTMCHTTRMMREAKISSNSSNSSISSVNSAINRGLTHSQSTPSHLHLESDVSTVSANKRHSNNEDSPDGAPKSARGGSRFRSRLDSARNQHHFLDEF